MQEMAVTDTSATCRIERPRVRKIGHPRLPNWTIRFPRKQLQFLVVSRGRAHPMSFLLISWGQSRKDRAGE
jgi:hypothetical protein